MGSSVLLRISANRADSIAPEVEYGFFASLIVTLYSSKSGAGPGLGVTKGTAVGISVAVSVSVGGE